MLPSYLHPVIQGSLQICTSSTTDAMVLFSVHTSFVRQRPLRSDRGESSTLLALQCFYGLRKLNTKCGGGLSCVRAQHNSKASRRPPENTLMMGHNLFSHHWPNSQNVFLLENELLKATKGLLNRPTIGDFLLNKSRVVITLGKEILAWHLLAFVAFIRHWSTKRLRY